ncbi:hypothetical protein C8J56DRAFT_893168 [Mycena floridula]|nr:hypothetical protein C8J56DRAFT_893168 [Mycena floridula]
MYVDSDKVHTEEQTGKRVVVNVDIVCYKQCPNRDKAVQASSGQTFSVDAVVAKQGGQAIFSRARQISSCCTIYSAAEGGGLKESETAERTREAPVGARRFLGI